MKLLLLSLVTAASVGAHALPAAPAGEPGIPAPSYAPLDTADSLWRRGRIAIADESWREAARIFERLSKEHPRSAYAGDALYWYAFAQQRNGGNNDLRAAVRALEQQRDNYSQSATYTSGESNHLLTRLNGRLARSGDSEAAMTIAELAASAAQLGVTVAADVLPMVAAELDRVSPEMRAEVAREVARMEPEMRRELRAELAEVQRDMRDAQRDLARTSRGRRGDDIPQECEDVITDERIEALNALLQMNAETALPILKRVLERRDRCSEYLRRKAVFLVAQKRSDEAVDILVSAAKTDPDPTTRSEAVFWLSQTRNERAVEVLEQILVKDAPDEEVQKKAIFALSQTRSPRASAILRDFAMRRDVSTELRGEAIFWLGQQRNEENAAFLKQVFSTIETDQLREKVIFSIAQQRNQENSRWLLDRAKDRQLSAETRKQALFWAGQSGASAEDLSAIYDSSPNDRELREQVIFALSQRRGDSKTVDKLLDIARKEQDRELRRQALFWLGQSKDPRAAAILEEIINKPM
ncbi:MAG: HEAT repeat domain-containing protein [Gemmatimonadaceae bacterium]|nr:HEAT repeat domain-containing protein [Gemmatimonadaceae bacterium]